MYGGRGDTIKLTMSPRHLCTYFDRNYLLKGLALYRSLCQNDNDFVLWVLCLDAETHNILTRIGASQIHVVTLHELEAWDPRLVAARADRTPVEYYWTCTPSWLAYVSAQQTSGTWVSYLDADIYFFGNPEAIYQEAQDASVIIHGHRFAARYQSQAATSGIYNVGLTAFRSDELATQVLSWWQAACLEACYLRPEAGYCGDQKYLDDWPERFDGVHVLQNPAAGLAPWNVTNYNYALNAGRLTVDTYPLIFYHFHALRFLGPHLMGQHGYDIPSIVGENVYEPYARALGNSLAEVRRVAPGFGYGLQIASWRDLARDALHGRYFWI